MDKSLKNNFLSIFYYSFNFFKEIAFILFLILLEKKLLGLLLIIISFILISLIYILKWKNINFIIEDNKLKYNCGVFSKKNLVISLDKITTVDLNQNIILMIFNLYKLKVDSGSVLSNESEFEIILKKEDALAFKNMLLTLNNNQNYSTSSEKSTKAKIKADSYIYTLSNKNLLLITLTKNYFILAITFSLYCVSVLTEAANTFNINPDDILFDGINKLESFVGSGLGFIIIFSLLILVIIIVSILINIGLSYIKYYNFKAYKYNDYINIEYGLINKKRYSLPIKNINAITYKQNIIKRIFKLYTLEITSIGYGDEKKEEAILYPIGKKDMLNKIVSDLLPSFIIKEEIISPPKKSLIRFIFMPTLIYSLFLIIFFIYVETFLFLFVPLLFILIVQYLNYKTIGICYDDRNLVTCTGAFKRTKSIIPYSKIQSISKSSNFFMRRKNLSHYKIDFYANIFKSFIFLNNLDDYHYENLSKKLL